MIYHVIDSPVEAVQVTRGMLDWTESWPDWAEGQIKVSNIIGASGAGSASLLNDTPIFEGDYLIKNIDAEDVITVTVERKAAFESRYIVVA